MKNKVLTAAYESSFKISILTMGLVGLLEVIMMIYTIVDPSLFGDRINTYRIFYVYLFTVAAIYIVLSLYARKDLENRFKLLNFANPLCSLLFYAWSLGITHVDASAYGTADSTVFMTFALVVSLSFFLSPGIYAVIAILADILMLSLTANVAGSAAPIVNLSIFFIFQLVLGVSFMRLKKTLAERIVKEHDSAVVDIMTGFANRRAYENDLSSPTTEVLITHLTYVAIDINGLKVTNDTLGHDAGDKLIIGAAHCIAQCFGSKGKVYRIGGDEFVAMVSTEDAQIAELLDAFDKSMASWTEHNDMTLSASYGYASRSEYPEVSLTELAAIADKRMYEAKERYYELTGSKRRTSQTDQGLV